MLQKVKCFYWYIMFKLWNDAFTKAVYVAFTKAVYVVRLTKKMKNDTIKKIKMAGSNVFIGKYYINV